MSQESLMRYLLEPVLHSIETQQNTDGCRQIGFKKIGKLDSSEYLANGKWRTRIEDSRYDVTAYELKNPTPDDRISLRFMHPDTIMIANAEFYCVPREWARKLGFIA